MSILSQVFYAHGFFCASHPWEILITVVTLMISFMSMNLWATDGKVCGWNYYCLENEEFKTSDVMILSVTRCLAIVYIYLQFRNLRKLGSKYLLVGGSLGSIFLFKGLAAVFTIFSSFIFSVAIANFIGFNLNGLNEALPFFLLLVDLSKASVLARLTLTAASHAELTENIGHSMAALGPALTLDVCVETLAIGVGTISGVRQLEIMCCYGCLSVIAYYLAFMTIIPAGLSLVLELSRDCNHGKPLQKLCELAKVIQKEEAEKIPPNPVTQRIKMIMALGLSLVHANSRLRAVAPSSLTPHLPEAALEAVVDPPVQPDMPLWQLYLTRFFTVRIDYVLTFLLAVSLTLKYILMDSQTAETPEEAYGRNISESNCTASKDQYHEANRDTSEGLRKRILSAQDTVIGSKRKVSFSTTHHDALVCDQEKYERVNKAATFFIEEDSNSSEGEENVMLDKATQTETIHDMSPLIAIPNYQDMSADQQPRPLTECISIMNSDEGPSSLTDAEVAALVASRHIPSYKLESMLGDHTRGVAIRRKILSQKLQVQTALDSLPFQNYDYRYVHGACCENVIGYMPVPVGVAGPLLLDGHSFHVPMATTEGCLVASTNRGCRALQQSGGVTSCVTNDGMTRGPVVQLPSALRASEMKKWMETKENFDLIKESFDSTSRFARLKKLHIGQAGRSLYIRFVSVTGDAMGMNMLSKGSEKALVMMNEKFPDMEVISLSGNFCTDKKPAAINWIEGRGKSVVCEAIVKSSVVKNTLKTSVDDLVELNISKNLVGSAMAGSIGGFNAHAANIVTAIYIAAGQDPAQNVSSSSCLLLMERGGPRGEDLRVSCTMPSLEVGTVGGGTVLPPQQACLRMLGVCGPHPSTPGLHAQVLARLVCAAVLAGELSLMAALAAGDLVRSHLAHNRSTQQISQESKPAPACAATTNPATQPSVPECPVPSAPLDSPSGACTGQAS